MTPTTRIKHYVESYPGVLTIWHPNKVEYFTAEEAEWLEENGYKVHDFEIGGSIITNKTLQYALEKYIDIPDSRYFA
jgi:hypothetical protein